MNSHLSNNPSSSTWQGNPSNRRPPVANRSKHPTPKLPGLMNHKVGVNNRRGVRNTDSNVAIPQRGFGDQNSSFYDSNQNIPSKGHANNNNNNRYSNRESQRGRGGRQAMRGSSGGRGYGESAYNKAPGRGRTARSPYEYQPQSVSSTGYEDYPESMEECSSNNEGPENSWSNSNSNSNRPTPMNRCGSYDGNPNNNNYNSNYYNTSNHVVKVQSGNVQPQFEMTRNNSRSYSRSKPEPTRSATSHNSRGHSSSNNNMSYIANDSGDASRSYNSIFDEEDVKQQPFNSYQKKPFIRPLDTSLRIFTFPIKDIQTWSEAQVYDGQILFEVYGLIASGPTDTESGLGKEFYLRDQSATIQCVFYEIDRNLPGLTKGQVHRIVGSLDKSKSHAGDGSHRLHVVSIRKADKEERQACQKATEVSLHEMDSLTRRLGKEP